ncbi:acyl-CoA thioesterase [Aquimarina intermedia]|uniref:Acyl-CoA thioester hydrolase n=1 Tax=Aquimarina intermedia TaxID=350814 RepID=A0A5S5CCJ4_9FLAO|nr:acyl-CoA thioesterase [Aquimarina intermedia]TYP76222.1 acyl-CoA thioester hydrolase [Aquimarina intermedia]
MYTKKFEVRWSDLDANRHLANSAYQNFMSHTRMAFLIENGFGQKEMAVLNVGPVIFYEHIYYFREVFQGAPVTVGLEVTGMSEDSSFFEFRHNFYDTKGKNLAHCEMLGAWMNLKERKIMPLPEALIVLINNFPKSDDFRVLTKVDTRKHNKFPKDLEIS